MTPLFSIAALALTAADPSSLPAEVGQNLEAVRTLKASERNLLDEIDELLLAKRRLQQKAKTLEGELDALRARAAAQKRVLDAEEENAERTRAHARAHARALRAMVRGQGLRYLLGAEGFFETLRRTRVLKHVYTRALGQLANNLAAVAREQARMAAWQRSVDDATGVLKSLRATEDELAAKSHEVDLKLTAVRERRAAHEQRVFDLKEAEARLAREEQAEAPPPDSPFGRELGLLSWPLSGPIVTPFGRLVDEDFGHMIFHSGIAIKGQPGSEVAAVFDGRVVFSQTMKALGGLVIIAHAGEYFTVYGHLRPPLLALGANAARGQKVAVVGDLPLYFEVRRHTHPEDPLRWLAH